MYYNLTDTRTHLPDGSRVETGACVYVIDRFLASGGFALMYLAHQEGTARYVALKELFPRHVENAQAERREDGRIVIYDPLTRTREDDNEAMWEELTGYLQREVALTRKAGLVYGRSGQREQQNSPDVLQITDLFQDARGNRYVAIDTAQGESLRDWIEQGFLKNSGGTVMGNGRLKGILEILEDTARLLDRLHGDNHMLHLDISPDNIYVTSSLGGTRMMPHIIDYGSAYDKEDPREKMDHRFTCNPWSAPEVRALAGLNDQEAGYAVDESSDTYAVVSILFWALTRQVYTPALRYSQSWRTGLRKEYGTGVTEPAEDSFPERLIALLEKGLSSDQTMRYRNAEELRKDLEELRKAYHTTANLPLMEEDELMSYVLLDQYPLYNYRSAKGDLDVLCLGSGRFVRRMILSILSTGQMIGSRLNIHVVSQDPEDSVRAMLTAAAPTLPQYSNLNGSVGDLEYVTFSFARVDNLLEPEICARTAREYAFCRYVVISLGRNSRNIDLARLYGRELSVLNAGQKGKTVIHYFMSEDAASNVRSSVSEEGIDRETVDLQPFGSGTDGYASAIRSLGRLTARLNYLYCKLSDPRISLEKTLGEFLEDRYNQRSSCASATHLRYKLVSVGISTASRTNHRSIVAAFQKVLSGPRRGELLELEHRRWLMYMIADGYRLPSMEEMEDYAFRTVGGRFIGAFKDPETLVHHCLVPCGLLGRCLPSSHEEWDRYESYEEIDQAPYDPLDRMSLKVHLLARRRVENPAAGEELKSDLANRVGGPLARWEERLLQKAQLQSAGEEALETAKSQAEVLRGQYRQLERSLDTLIRTRLYSDEIERVKRLQEIFAQAGIQDADFDGILHGLEIYREFSGYRDYKESDNSFVDNLLWLLFAGESPTLIKLAGRSMVSNITGPLILEPADLIYYGMEPREELREFLRSHGNQGNIRFQVCGQTGAEEIFQDLKQLRASIPGRVVLDITDSGEVLTAAAMRVAQRARNTAVIRSDERIQRIENVQGFSLAGAYRLHTSISAQEVYNLYGAKEIAQEDKDYMQKLDRVADRMWEFYQKYRDSWDLVCGFFAIRGAGSPELRLRFNTRDNAAWSTFSASLLDFEWKGLRLKDCFEKMEKQGLIRNLRTQVWNSPWVELSFEYPGSSQDGRTGKAFNFFFSTRRSACALEPYECSIQQKDGETAVYIESGSMVDIYDYRSTELVDRTSGKKFTYASMVPVLRSLEAMGLIRDLQISEVETIPVQIHFAYTNMAVKDCLMKAGNILELYAWHCARRTGWFDDCRANLAFRWKEGVENELDLILTWELKTLVVSCKTAKFNKDHLYEIRYLTDRFSLSSKPVIIYSSTMAVEGGRLTTNTESIRKRAKAMGIYLLDTNNLAGKDLGEILKDIADGKRDP